MRRIITLVTVALVMALMVVFAGPASAQGGCKAFGQGIAEFAPHKDAPTNAPISDDIAFYHTLLCSGGE